MAKRKRLSPTVALTGMSESADGRLENTFVSGAGRAPIADVSADSAARAAFEDVSEELRRARKEGRLVLSLPLDAVDASYLVRDRVVMEADALAELTESLRARGQQTPIEVVKLDQERYGLISGWRRLTALQRLHQETGDASFGVVKALLRAPDTQSNVYRAMVEENEIRAALSFYERARIAVKAVEQGAFTTVHSAVQSLFSTARAPKRSKIVAFVTLVEQLDDVLHFPAAVPEKVGLSLSAVLQEDTKFRVRLMRALQSAKPETPADERRVLDQLLKARAQASRSVPKSGATEEIVPGVSLSLKPGGLTLSGQGVDDQFQEDLRAWIADR